MSGEALLEDELGGGVLEEALSILSPIGYSDNRCGYCGRGSGSRSYYASAKLLTPKFYEDLICRGWRRSGTTLYKPDLLHSCCPHYTIRLDSQAFKASKDQRQTLNRFNGYIIGDAYSKERTRLHPLSRKESSQRKQEFNVVERVHESDSSSLNTLSSGVEPDHKLVVTLEQDNFTDEKYRLFENYQRLVHKEPPSRISRSGFRSFLCSSPILPCVQSVAGREKKLGSYHQCYRLGGKLVAIGVLDLLPNAVSAVYFMYHSSIESWSPGKLSALRETALSIEGGYRFYMMGFYIHSCVKMRYKGDFKPQSVLDPEEYTWDALDEDLKRRMEQNSYVCMSKERRSGEHLDKRRKLSIGDGMTNNGEKAHDVVEAAIDESTKKVSLDESGTDSDSSLDLAPLPLHARDMPGVLSRLELEKADLSSIKLLVGDALHETGDLVVWDTGSLNDPMSLKCLIADLVSALGTDLAARMAVGFG